MDYASLQGNHRAAPAVQRTGDMRPVAVFCKGLAKGTSESCIGRLFAGCIDVQIARHRSGRSAGFAIVSFASHEQAAGAMAAMDGSVYMGRKLSVRWYQPEQDSGSAQAMAVSAAAVDAGAVAQQHSLLLLQAAASNPDMLSSMFMQQLFMSGGGGNHHQVLPPLPHFAQNTASAGGAVPRAQPMVPMHERNVATLSDLGGWPAAAALSSHRPVGAPVAARTTSDSTASAGGDRAPAWSATVNLWLQDYEQGTGSTQHRAPGHHADADLRRSFDAFPSNPGYVERRRSTRDSLSRMLDSLNLADAGIVTAEPPAAASRVTTGGSGGAHAAPSSAAAAALGTHPACAAHVSDEVKLMSPGRLVGGVFGSGGPWGVPTAKGGASADNPAGKGGALSLLPVLSSSWEGDDRIGTALDQRAFSGSSLSTFSGSSLSSSLQSTRHQHQQQPLHHHQAQQPQQQHQVHNTSSTRPHLPSIDFGMVGVSPPLITQQQDEHQMQYAAALHQLSTAHNQALQALQALQAQGVSAPGQLGHHLRQAGGHHALGQQYMGLAHLRNM
ncbi:hypothetical protein FOA52_006534 [Chlamydomonas sp. UWO 241]|nr:hypothetical protein FOA52_006534 [Chlamydomonas sp. UWO 241]